ncbi:RidA family protein [Saccharopolyspora shandongensis]|uniref:RidA family protein n=1 Tax=Saccharopolyspora shandongensis TaxID=418495 RepID=UPI003F4DCB30
MQRQQSSPARNRLRRLTRPAVIAAMAGIIGLGIGSQTMPASAGDESGTAHRVITSADAPAAIGPYSQGIAAGNHVYLSGQLPLDRKTNQIPEGATIQDQTRQVLRNLEAVLEAADMSLDDVVSTTVYLTDLDDFAAFNATYAEFFAQRPPARATVEVAQLSRGAKLEISAIAVR